MGVHVAPTDKDMDAFQDRLSKTEVRLNIIELQLNSQQSTNEKVDQIHRLVTGADDPDKGVLMKLDRIIRQFEAIQKKEDRILAFAVVGVGSGLTGFISFAVSLALWLLTK